MKEFASLPHYSGGSTPPDQPASTGSVSPAIKADLRVTRRVCRAIWAEAPYLFTITASAAIFPAYLVAYLDSLNDKPGGSHANFWSYPKVVLIAALAAGLAALIRRAIGRPRTFEAQVFVPVLLGGLAVLTVSLTFCLWGGWVFGHGTYH